MELQRSAPRGNRLQTLLILGLACGGSVAVGLLNQPYFEVVNAFARAQDAVPRGLLFSSWLLLIGVPIVIRDPRRFGLTVGSIGDHWRLIGIVTAGAAAVTAGLVLLIVGPTPYSTASLFIETIDVPVSEELVFRGVLFTLLLATLGRLHQPSTAATLAIVFCGLAFGLAHVANATSLEPGFVLSQMVFASALGAACSYLMFRTASAYPAMFLHAVVNGVIVLL